ncbi:MAG: DUF1501 domain-containing protein [Planctomycetales bacterium]|nr:DUF1501 domain-containing protein [Planctomycetales bacterium]
MTSGQFLPIDGRWNRRDWMRIGAVSLGAMSLGTNPWSAASTATLDASTGDDPASASHSCIFVLLQGGPSHIDLWDPKPLAGSDVRGSFAPASTSVPSVHFTELVPEMAKRFDQFSVVRSVSHPFANHIAGTYITLTGSYNQQDRDREAHGDDFPGPGAILPHLQPPRTEVPASISLPNWLSIPGPSNRMPGQYGGFLGAVRDPFVLEGDPNGDGFDPLGLKSGSALPIERLDDRRGLLTELDVASRWLDSEVRRSGDRYLQSAFELVCSGKFRTALDLGRESDETRDRYGRNKLGQSFLLARRLIEAGVRWVSINEFNQKWDTHGDLVRRYQDIVPPLDRAYGALLDDLSRLGLERECMVCLGGEFGRTPKINPQAGRDHWPNAYSMLLAGGKVRGGVAWGETDAQGAEVAAQGVRPADVLATLWQHLGIDPKTTIHDRLDRPYLVSEGRVLYELMG